MPTLLNVEWKQNPDGTAELYALCGVPCAIVQKEQSIPEQCDHLKICKNDITEESQWCCDKGDLI